MTTRIEPTFPGFDVPEQNWFRLPNSWTNITAEITSLAELKVVEYVLRHTWGYQEYGISKRISTDEFMEGRKRSDGTRMDKGTGLSNKSVIDGLKRAVEDGLLVEEVDDTDRGRIKKYYSVRMKQVHTPMKKVHSRGEDSPYQSVRSPQRSEKDTLEKETNGKTPEETTTAPEVVVDLLTYGITEDKAQEFNRRFEPRFLWTKMELLDWKLSRPEGKKITDIAGWLVAAIEEDYQPPEGFETSWEREERETRQRQERIEFYKEYQAKREAYLAEHPEP